LKVPTAPPLDSAAVNGNRVDLLELDLELAHLIGRSNGAPEALWTSVMKLERGPWAPEWKEPPRDHLGFLVIDGLLGRRVFVPDRGRSLELLAGGDLVRPWEEDAASFSQVSWTVIEPTRLAALDDGFTARARERPELFDVLTDRALRRSRRLAVGAAIANTVGVEDRLLLLLWQLAELWGRMAPGGAVLPFRLSHQTLADLVGARRPTVTLALRSLTEDRRLERGDSGEWRLIGDPP
jgi:CRP/FNR family transcriptional regulator, cyclic AMP receptor protein